mmetsp:Transcript_27427/g.57233  ORF Transcript_27427/g.57233 Transcript_27427/m.57233 type:complete len:185 (-) Transcript_27427:304-858(-)
MTSYQVHTAVKTNSIEALKACVFKATEIPSFSLNQEDENGVTGLIEACISGNTEMVQLLLDARCPAQPTGDFRHTPLRGATLCGNHHLIPILLKAGSDPNALSEGNRTPLMGACFLRSGIDRERSALCVKALLEDPRTDPSIRNSFGESALDLAKIREYTESIALVEEALVKWEKGNDESSTLD